MRRVILLLVFAVLLSGSDHARADDGNAATWYRRAIERLPRPTGGDWEHVWRYADDPSGAPSPELRAALAKAGPIIDALRRGARREQVFFDPGGAEGFESLLGPLANIQRAARLLRADALVHLHDGDTTGAADRLAAIYHLSDHLGAYGLAKHGVHAAGLMPEPARQHESDCRGQCEPKPLIPSNSLRSRSLRSLDESGSFCSLMMDVWVQYSA
ncbi:MAG: hypothetical protein SYC29_15220 [Planctomycetota bacterium]|nr:hypothetical protein [Planctomycetota bacterium]